MLSALTASPLLAMATEVVPVSYGFDQATGCGTFCYHDETGKQLIDGSYGVEGWGVNLGSGGACEWVGWYGHSVVNIDFNKGSVKSIDAVMVGTTQDSTSDVVLPSLDVSYWNGSSWVLVQSLNVPESSANDRYWLSPAPHGFLTLGGLGIIAQNIRVTARFSSDGPWTFIDEVDFTAAAVPEPSTYALMALGLTAVGALARRRHGRSQRPAPPQQGPALRGLVAFGRLADRWPCESHVA